MRAQAAPPAQRFDPVRIVCRLEDLEALLADEVDGVIWTRQLPLSVGLSLGALAHRRLADGRFCAAVGDVGGCIDTLFHEWGVQIGPAQRWFADDVETLAREFAQILSASHVLVRVEWVHDDACRKFHRDAVRARLICTYSGPGTEYGVAKGGADPHHIDAVPTGSPILLKGKLWSGPAECSIQHRSPPVEGTSMSRLVVVINEATPEQAGENPNV